MRIFFLLVILLGCHAALFCQNQPLVRPRPNQSQFSCIDVSEDGEWLAAASGNIVTISSLVDGHTLNSFSAASNVVELKISPDKSKVAVFSANFTIMVVDLKKGQSLFEVQTIDIRPFIKDTSKLDAVIRVAAGIPIFKSQHLKFQGTTLLYLFTQYMIEIYLDNKPQPIYEQASSDFSYQTESKNLNRSYSFRVVNQPWFSQTDEISGKKIGKILIDPTVSFGMIEYEEKGKKFLEVWDLKKAKRKHLTQLNANYMKDYFGFTNLELDPSGDWIFFYRATYRNPANFRISGRLIRQHVSTLREEILFDIPDSSYIANVHLSENGNLVFAEGLDFDIKGEDAAYKLSLYERQDPVYNSKYWVYQQQDRKLSEVRLNDPRVGSQRYLESTGDLFLNSDNNVYRYHIADRNLSVVQQTKISPAIRQLVYDPTGKLMVASEDGIRTFDLFMLRQEAFYPASVKEVAFGPGMAYYSDSNAVRQLNLRSGENTLVNKMYKSVGAMTLHSSGLVTGDYNYGQSSLDTCSLVTVQPGSGKGSVIKRGSVFGLSISADNKYMAVVSRAKDPLDSQAMRRIVDAASTDALELERQMVKIFNSDSTGKGSLALWQFSKGKWQEQAILAEHRESVKERAPLAVFSPDGKYIAMADAKLQIHVWEMPTGKKITTFFSEHGNEMTRQLYILNRVGKTPEEFRTLERIQAMTFSPDGNLLVTGGTDGQVHIWERKGYQDTIYNQKGTPLSNKLLDLLNEIPNELFTQTSNFTLPNKITSLCFSTDGRLLFVGTDGGRIYIYDRKVKDFLFVLLLKRHSDGYAAFGGPYAFYANPAGGDLIYFQNSQQPIPLEYLDLAYNNPILMDTLLTWRLGDYYKNDSKLAAKFLRTSRYDAEVINKRLSYSGLPKNKYIIGEKKWPLVKIVNRDELLQQQTTLSDSIVLEIQGTGIDNVLLYDGVTTIHIWVNGVPVFGTNGLTTWRHELQMKRSVTIALSPGINRIQVASETLNGVRSEKESLLIYKNKDLFKPDLYLVVLGVADYKNTSFNLKYPLKDGRDLIQKFRSSSIYRNIIIDTLFDTQLTLAAMGPLQKKLKQAGPGDVILIFYSGHGLQNSKRELFLGLHGLDKNNLKETALPFHALEELVNTTNARQKLVLLDACQTGLSDKGVSNQKITTAEGKGEYEPLSREDSLFLSMREMFADIGITDGSLTIAATSGYQNAKELDSLEHGVFSYAVLNALDKNELGFSRADVNRDGEVSAIELMNYTRRFVPLLNKGQTPTIRSINPVNDFRLW